jgi:outer membrane murein-binding lipoprotein Lpp
MLRLDGAQMTRFTLLALLSPVALFAGCATSQDSKDRLATETAELFGVKADQVAISNRRVSGTTIYYTAQTNSVEYGCSTEISSVANLVMSMGVTHPPKCQKKATLTKN